jgi:hypothetical protein
MELGKYSLGVGDRFGMQGSSLLKAFEIAASQGISITPVWNKSHREHKLTGTHPPEVRIEADEAVKISGWKSGYFVDADHINEDNVEEFIGPSDFFTIDVAEYIGVDPGPSAIESSTNRNLKYAGLLSIPGLAEPFTITREFLADTSRMFLKAAIQAGRIYKFIENRKGRGNFITEVSMDEVGRSQSPAELFFILGFLSQEGIPLNTIAPRFTGSFHKGIDYSGDVNLFESEFEQDLFVIDLAKSEFDMSANLKLSVHSGSDKRSIYPAINRLLRKFNSGIHLKTAGTTWLEEFIGVILSGRKGHEFGISLYKQALKRIDELISPYVYVTRINHSNLPDIKKIDSWSAGEFARAITHNADDEYYNPDLRQFIHLSYKIAAENIGEYRQLVMENPQQIAERVTENIFKNHIAPIFSNRK